jgi:hypothetical protein
MTQGSGYDMFDSERPEVMKQAELLIEAQAVEPIFSPATRMDTRSRFFSVRRERRRSS